jgi:tetratricopeptide (TPR) repeat protein
VCAAVAVLLGAMVLAAWRRRELAAPLAAFLFPLAPLAVALPSAEAASERYFLLPSVGLAWALALVLAPLRRGRAPALALLGAATLAFAAQTAQRVPAWRSDATIFAAAVAVDPDDPLALFQLGAEDWRQHDEPAALAHLERAVASARARGARPTTTGRMLYALSWMHGQRHETDEALELAREAVALVPNNPRAYFAVAEACLQGQRWPEALQALDATLALSPELEEVRLDRSRLRAQLGDRAGAGRDLAFLRAHARRLAPAQLAEAEAELRR